MDAVEVILGLVLDGFDGGTRPGGPGDPDAPDAPIAARASDDVRSAAPSCSAPDRAPTALGRSARRVVGRGGGSSAGRLGGTRPRERTRRGAGSSSGVLAHSPTARARRSHHAARARSRLGLRHPHGRAQRDHAARRPHPADVRSRSDPELPLTADWTPSSTTTSRGTSPCRPPSQPSWTRSLRKGSRPCH